MESINVAFLEQILKEKINFIQVGPGSNVGDNYTSLMHSIKITFEKDPQRSIYLVLKTYPTHPARQQFLEETNMFRKEFLVYDTLLPDLVSFANDRCRSILDQEEIKLAFPPFVHGRAVNNADDLSPHALANYLLMVDIRKTWGYKMADRYDGLDVAHCRLLMKELAKFHALAWCYKVAKGGQCQVKSINGQYPFLKGSAFCPGQGSLTELLLDQGFSLMGSMLEEKLGVDSEVYKGFQRLKLNAATTLLLYLDNVDDVPDETVASLMRIKPIIPESTIPWKVICHGDCWSNNLLFLYDALENFPKKIMLVDLQKVREACPTTDLAYFFYTSTTSDLRQNHLDDLLDLYAQHFLEYCTLFGGRTMGGFSSAELKRRFHRSKPYGLLIATIVLPFSLRSADDQEDLDKLALDAKNLPELLSAMQRKPGDNELISKRIVSMAQELFEQGVI